MCSWATDVVVIEYTVDSINKIIAVPGFYRDVIFEYINTTPCIHAFTTNTSS